MGIPCHRSIFNYTYFIHLKILFVKLFRLLHKHHSVAFLRLVGVVAVLELVLRLKHSIAFKTQIKSNMNTTLVEILPLGILKREEPRVYENGRDLQMRNLFPFSTS